MIAVAPDNRTAYTANIGSGTVSVLDLAEGKKLRDLAVGGKPEGLALTKGGRELWVGDLDAPRVSIWDTATGEKIAELPVDAVPIRVLASPYGKPLATRNIAGSEEPTSELQSSMRIKHAVFCLNTIIQHTNTL